ncbi:hypothetical protein LCGC14_2527660 [marine sediment metagenome]|uniref:Uncharacterized protein n=1 Tax=marine sediment metagenome TaxID=412755 RepID=A0A0F9DMU6_9ZZZZ
MKCPKCKLDMDYEDGIHRWHERTWYCSECDVEIVEDITGELIDHAKDLHDDIR